MSASKSLGVFVAYAPKKQFEIRNIYPSSPTAKIGQVIRVNRDGIAYLRVPKVGNSLDVCCDGNKLLYVGSSSWSSDWDLSHNVGPGKIGLNEQIATFTFDKLDDYMV